LIKGAVVMKRNQINDEIKVPLKTADGWKAPDTIAVVEVWFNRDLDVEESATPGLFPTGNITLSFIQKYEGEDIKIWIPHTNIREHLEFAEFLESLESTVETNLMVYGNLSNSCVVVKKIRRDIVLTVVSTERMQHTFYIRLDSLLALAQTIRDIYTKYDSFIKETEHSLAC